MAGSGLVRRVKDKGFFRFLAASPGAVSLARRAYLDALCVLYALWTVATHATMFFEQNLYALLGVFAAGIVALGAWTARRAGETGVRALLVSWVSEDEAVVPATVSPPTPRLASYVAVAAVLGAVAYHWAVRDARVFVWIVALLLVALASSDSYPDLRLRRIRPSMRQELVLVALAITCVVVSLWAHRSSSDDTFYVNTAVSIADHPENAVMTYNTMVGVPDVLIHAPYYKVHTYEALAGAVSFLTGLSGLAVSHWVLPVVAALMIPGAWALLAMAIGGRNWLWIVVFVVAFYLVEGSAYSGFSNHALVRIQHGKAVLLAVGVPLMTAHSVRFMVSGRWRDAIMLGCTAVACLGLTSTALMLVAVVVGLSSATMWRPTLQGTRRLFVVLACLGYPVCVAFYVKHLMSSGDWSQASASEDGPAIAVVGEAAAKVFTDEAFGRVLGAFNVQVPLLCATLLAAVLPPRGSAARRFATLYMLGFFLVLFNPEIADKVRRVLSPIYWRLLWCLPLPFFVALAFSSVIRHRADTRRWLARVAIALGGYAVFLWRVPNVFALGSSNGVQLHPPGYKVPSVFQVSAWINLLVPTGTVVAVPEQVGFWLTTMNHHAYPLTTKARYLDSTMPIEESGRRAALTQFVAWGAVEAQYLGQMKHKGGQFLPVLEDALGRYHLGAVCLAPWNRMLPEIRAMLSNNGYRMKQYHDGFEIWLRSDLFGHYAGATITRLPEAPKSSGKSKKKAPKKTAAKVGKRASAAPSGSTGSEPAPSSK